MTAEPGRRRAQRSRVLLLVWIGAVLLGGLGIAVSLFTHSLQNVGVGLEAALAKDPAANAAGSSPLTPVTQAPPKGSFELPEPGGRALGALEVDPAWVSRVAASTGVPERALAAYAGAAGRLSREHPLCGLGWNTLAGIGFVETEHGTHGGSRIGADGRAEPAIVGIALDGASTDAISDTDGGALDGDAVWDRAVGPMQFIPSTWAEWASDGNGDGVAEPQQIDDAAYAAGRYLCAVGGDLRSSEGWIAAVAGYNDTVEYNHRVAEAANHYARVA